ncbi:hypothetical protein C0Q70_21606 [Pomacea canaliculata]|uniref:Uncharacterized protein n=1 Tax=Pomacea canaliculata TaxID=400727 RepID=A0A2T7ND07_POMCA|nr:uncharacterized protein LOC112555810 [Pomacea canaliculata]PVD19047.1 hypothetical protein C0Q70_21606 [Pomacea canaliculata]
MKVAVVVVLLLVAGQLPKNEAAFLSSLGDFFSSALESFSNTALQALANVGERLLRNVTATTTGLLSETGQMLLFELGDLANSKSGTGSTGGKRDLSELLHALEQLKQELPSELSTAFGELRTEAEKFLQGVTQVVGHLTTGRIDPQAVLESIPELEKTVERLTSGFSDNLVQRVGSLVSRLLGIRSRRTLGLLEGLRQSVESFVEPLVSTLRTDLGVVTQTVESLARNLLSGTDLGSVVNNLLGNLGLLG